MAVPQMDGLWWKILLEWMIWGEPHSSICCETFICIYIYIYIILYPHDIPVTSPVKVNINHHKSRYFGLGGLANKCTYKNWCSQRYVGLALCCPSSRRSLDHPLGGFNMSQLSRQPLDECGKPNVIKHPQVITMESPKCVYWIAFGKPRRP